MRGWGPLPTAEGTEHTFAPLSPFTDTCTPAPHTLPSFLLSSLFLLFCLIFVSFCTLLPNTPITRAVVLKHMHLPRWCLLSDVAAFSGVVYNFKMSLKVQEMIVFILHKTSLHQSEATQPGSKSGGGRQPAIQTKLHISEPHAVLGPQGTPKPLVTTEVVTARLLRPFLCPFPC